MPCVCRRVRLVLRGTWFSLQLLPPDRSLLECIGQALRISPLRGNPFPRLKETVDREKDLARKDMLTGGPKPQGIFSSGANRDFDRLHRYKHPFTLA